MIYLSTEDVGNKFWSILHSLDHVGVFMLH